MFKATQYVTLLVALVASTALAQTSTTVAGGFNSPMGVMVAPEGDIWVIDSGMGGEQELETVSPEGEKTTAKIGDTARIVRVSPSGEQTVVATLPSMLTGMEATGGARLALHEGTVYATSGVWIEFAGPEPLPLMSSVVKVEGESVSEVANIWSFETTENPDGFVKESHPYGIAVGPDGMLYVSDAGANDLVRVDPATGEVTLVVTFDGIPGPLPNPARGGSQESDPVPTSVVFGEDGMMYVSLLPGFPFTPGSAKVVTVAEDGSVSDYATGLTMVTDLTLGPDGALYAVQFGEFGEQGPTPNTGAVVRIQDGQPETVLDDLSFPTAIAFAEDGSAYLTINGVGAPGSGELVKLTGLAQQASR